MSETTLTLVKGAQQLSMTHKDIAEVVKSRPDNVKVSIERLAERGIIQLPATKVLEEISNLGLPIKRECYVFEGEQGRRDSIVVVAQLCPEFTAQIVDRWQELEKEKEKSQILTTTAPIRVAPAVQLNDGIIQLARVVAEATMKACLDATGYTQPTAPLPLHHVEGEYVPVSKAAWATGLSDSTCRKLIGFAKVPIRSTGGVRGLLVELPAMETAAQTLLNESAPPKGNRKRWTHPRFGNFTYYADLI